MLPPGGSLNNFFDNGCIKPLRLGWNKESDGGKTKQKNTRIEEGKVREKLPIRKLRKKGHPADKGEELLTKAQKFPRVGESELGQGIAGVGVPLGDGIHSHS